MRLNRNTARNLALLTTLAATGLAAAQPDLVMRLDGNVLPSFSQVEFGPTNVGESQQLVITLRNEGNEDLVFTEDPAVQLAGSFPGEFALIQPALEVGNKLGPNSSTAFAVRFEPTIEFANLSANVFLFTNQQVAPFRLTVRGAGTQGELAVSFDGTPLADADTFAFDDTPVGETTEATFEIANVGTGLLSLGAMQIAGGLGETVMEALPVGTGVLAPGEITLLTIRFQPTDARPYATNLFVGIQTPDGPEVGLSANLTGTGFEPVQEDPGDDPQNDDGDEEEDDQNDDVDPNQPGDLDDDNNDDQDEQIDNDDNNEQDDEQNDPNTPNDFEQDEVDDLNDDNDEQQNDDEDNNDNNQQNEQDDEFDNETDDLDVDIDPDLVTPLTCGFGAGFASLASMASLGGLRYGRRRRIR